MRRWGRWGKKQEKEDVKMSEMRGKCEEQEEKRALTTMLKKMKCLEKIEAE